MHGDATSISRSALSCEEGEPSYDIIHKSDHSMSANIQFMSDLHLEKKGYIALAIPREAPYLLLLGDIGLLRQESLFLDFLRRECEMFDLVMLVLGNHEFYGLSRGKGLEVAEQYKHELGEKFVLLHRESVVLADGKTVIVGCTLHSLIPTDYIELTADFSEIRGWSVKQHNEEHGKDRLWLEQTLDEIARGQPNKRVIIATHYAPAYEQTSHPEHKDDPLRHCFCSNTLANIKERKGSESVYAWLSGHAHFNSRF